MAQVSQEISLVGDSESRWGSRGVSASEDKMGIKGSDMHCGGSINGGCGGVKVIF